MLHNKYVCDVVHRIEVQLWDKTEQEGLKDIRESLFNFKCDNSDQFVYFYNQETKEESDGRSRGLVSHVFSVTDSEDPPKTNSLPPLVRSTFYFQLPEPTSSQSKSKKLQIEVRGLQLPDPAKQSLMDTFVQQKLEETKLEDIAHRLNRNSQVSHVTGYLYLLFE